MHLVSKRDFNSAELETVRTSGSPTTVVTANGEVQTKEEATVYVRELDLFVTVMLLEDTPAGLSLGEHFEDHGYNYHWTSGQKPHLIKNGRKIDCNTANYVPFVVPGLSTCSSISSSPTFPTSSSQETVTPTEHPALTRSESVSVEVQGNLSHGPAETENTNKNDDNEEVRGNLSHDLPEWPQEWWYKTWPPNGSRRIRAKTKLHKKPREACKSSWNPRGNQKPFTLTIPWNSANPVKISPGIIARVHHTDHVKSTSPVTENHYKNGYVITTFTRTSS